MFTKYTGARTACRRIQIETTHIIINCPYLMRILQVKSTSNFQIIPNRKCLLVLCLKYKEK